MSTETNKLVTFRLGEDLFAADIHAVERVLRYSPPTPVPDVPPYIEGVMDYQKRVVPVLNLRRRFELPAIAVRAETRVLVLNTDDEWVGVVVDGVTEVAPYDPVEIEPPPRLFRGLAGEYLRGIVRRGERLVLFLDVARLLSSTDRIALETARPELTTHE